MSFHPRLRLAEQALPGACFSHGADRNSGRAAEIRVCDPLNPLPTKPSVVSIHCHFCAHPTGWRKSCGQVQRVGEEHVLSPQEPYKGWDGLTGETLA